MIQLGWLWPCPQILKPDWIRVSKDKPSSLLGLVVTNEGKKFYNIDTSGLYYKTIMIVNDDRKWRHNLEHHLWS